MHAEGDYARMWVSLYEDVVQNGAISLAAGYPCRVNGSYIMSPSPLPRWDLPMLNQASHLTLLGAGRCGSTGTFLDEIYDERTGKPSRVCSDSGFCDLVQAGVVPAKGAPHD